MDTIKKLSGKALSDHLIAHPEEVTEDILKGNIELYTQIIKSYNSDI